MWCLNNITDSNFITLVPLVIYTCYCPSFLNNLKTMNKIMYFPKWICKRYVGLLVKFCPQKITNHPFYFGLQKSILREVCYSHAKLEVVVKLSLKPYISAETIVLLFSSVDNSEFVERSSAWKGFFSSTVDAFNNCLENKWALLSSKNSNVT